MNKGSGWIRRMVLGTLAGAGVLTVSALLGYSFWVLQQPESYQPVRPASSSALSAPAVSSVSKVPLPQAVPAKVSQELAPLHLKLVGIFIPQRQGDAVALIQEPEGPARVYRVGDAVPGGDILKEIGLRQATVRRLDGTDAVLKLAEASSNARKRQIVTHLSETERLINREAIRQKMLSVALELSQVEVKPRVAQGRMLGFQVTGTSPQGVLSALGLGEGDVVSSINGMPLSNYRQATQLLGEAMQAPTFEVTVIKEGSQPQSLTYHWTA